MNHGEPFHFYTERRLVQLTGLRARTLDELVHVLREVPGSSVFYHTHHRFLSHHFQKPVVYNDFAEWVGEALREAALSERLAAIDLRRFTSVRQIRETLVSSIEHQIACNGGRPRECADGEEFHFCKSRSFILSTGLIAAGVAEFFDQLPHVSNVSLYFHFLEARLRIENPTNDFSLWLSGRGRDDLARAIESLDPYALTLDELKDEMIGIGRRYGVN